MLFIIYPPDYKPGILNQWSAGQKLPMEQSVSCDLKPMATRATSFGCTPLYWTIADPP